MELKKIIIEFNSIHDNTLQHVTFDAGAQQYYWPEYGMAHIDSLHFFIPPATFYVPFWNWLVKQEDHNSDQLLLNILEGTFYTEEMGIITNKYVDAKILTMFHDKNVSGIMRRGIFFVDPVCLGRPLITAFNPKFWEMTPIYEE